MTNRRHQVRGLSLLEVLIAASILSLGLTALATAIPLVLSIIASTREVSDANRVAGAATEQLVMTWAEDPDRVPPTGTIVVDTSGREDSAGRFTVSWELRPDRPIAGHTGIIVTTSWIGQAGQSRKRTMRTYVSGVP